MRITRLSRGKVALSACVVLAGLTGAQASAARVHHAARGGTLTIAAVQAPVSLNPLLNGNNPDELYYNDLAYEPLIYLAPNGSYQPGLATSWHYNNNLTAFDLQLRRGVRFSDGSPLTAQAVVRSIEAVKQANGPIDIYANVIKSVVATGPLSVQINLTGPDPDVPLIMTQRMPVGDIVSPKALASASSESALATETDGAGPYVLDQSATTPGDTYTYVPNRYYYDQSAIHFQRFVIKVIPDLSTSFNALRTGQIAFADGAFTSAPEAKADGLSVYSALSTWFGGFLFDRNSGPLRSLLVRQALNYATNRPAITATIFGSFGKPSDEVSLPGYVGDGYAPGCNSYYSYNVAKAKKLLAEAGYPKGFTLTMGASDAWNDGAQIAQALASDWSAIGVTVNIKTYPSLVQMLGPWKSAQLPSLAGGYDGQPLYIEQGQLLAQNAGLFNPYKTANSALTALIHRAMSATTKSAAAKDWTAAECEVVKLAWFVPVSSGSRVFFAQKSLHGIGMSSVSFAPDPAVWYE